MPPPTRLTGARPRTNKPIVIPARRINYVLPTDQGVTSDKVRTQEAEGVAAPLERKWGGKGDKRD